MAQPHCRRKRRRLRDIAVGSPDTSIHRPGEGNVAVLYGKPRGVHINLSDLWENGYPYYFHIDFPALDYQHVGESIAGVGDVTGDGWPDLAIGAPQADANGRVDSGSVWVISGHLPPIDAGCSMHMVDNSCPWIRLKDLTAAQGYRIDGAAAGDGLGSSLAGVGDQNGDGIPDIAIGESAASPAGRSGAGAVVVVPGQRGVTVRNLATAPPLQRFYGAQAGGGLGASLAAAGIDGDGHIDLLAGAPASPHSRARRTSCAARRARRPTSPLRLPRSRRRAQVRRAEVPSRPAARWTAATRMRWSRRPAPTARS
jgi:hypothetical protein